MREANCRGYFVHILPAGAPAVKELHLEIIGIDAELNLFCLRQNRHCSCRGMDSSRGFGDWHPLHSMDTTLVLEAAEGTFTSDFKYQLLEPSSLALIAINDLHLPALSLGISAIHAEQVSGKKACLLTTSTSPYLDNDISIIIEVFGHQRKPKCAKKLTLPFFDLAHFFLN